MRAFGKSSPTSAFIGLIGLFLVPAAVAGAIKLPVWLLDVPMSPQAKMASLAVAGALGVFWLIGFWFFCEAEVA